MDRVEIDAYDFNMTWPSHLSPLRIFETAKSYAHNHVRNIQRIE